MFETFLLISPTLYTMLKIKHHYISYWYGIDNALIYEHQRITTP